VRYPRTAEQGRVTLRVLVNREGRVAKATLATTSGYQTLDRHALEAVRGWRFAPARKGDEAVEQWLVVNVDY
jgi:periplasmic protein TonB